jgi:hypothetical protein
MNNESTKKKAQSSFVRKIGSRGEGAGTKMSNLSSPKAALSPNTQAAFSPNNAISPKEM